MSSNRKLAAKGAVLAASFTWGSYSFGLIATPPALPFVLGCVAIAGTSYAVGEYFKSRK